MNISESSGIYTVVRYLQDPGNDLEKAATALADLTTKAHRALQAGPILDVLDAADLLRREPPLTGVVAHRRRSGLPS